MPGASGGDLFYTKDVRNTKGGVVMLTNWQIKYIEWPDWVKMLLLVGLTVVSMAATVIAFAWLLEMLMRS